MEDRWKGTTDIAGLDEILKYYETMFPPDALRAFFTTNHDENSHSGSEYERMGEAAMPFAVFCCTWNGIPLIYSGQEIPNYKRLKFFDKDPIEWNGQYRLHDFYKKLLQLRKSNPALRAGDTTVSTIRLITDANHFVFAFLRKHARGEVMVMLNLSPEDKPLVRVPDEQLGGKFYNLFSGVERDFNNEKYFALRPWEWQVYVRKF
jgi:glycosidase